MKEGESKKPTDYPPLVLVNPVESGSNLVLKCFASVPKNDEAKNNARSDSCDEFTRFKLEMAEEKAHNV